MAGAVGSSSIAGMATSVNKKVRVRACSYSSGTAQHGGSGRKCREERMKGRKKMERILLEERAIRTGKERHGILFVVLLIIALRVSWTK